MKKRLRGRKLKKNIPRVFLSYTHESPQHKGWVRKLARDLRANGVDAVLDQWECKFGSELNLFMERGIENSDRVLLICTPEYRRKANAGKGGVGYERLVVTTAIARNIETEKFICILRNGDRDKSIPTFAKSRLYIDFRNDGNYRTRLKELLRDIHLFPAIPKPPLGPNPFPRGRVHIKVARRLAKKDADAKAPPIGENPFDDVPDIAFRPLRRRMPETRTAITHKFDISGHEGFLTIGLFEDGGPGELQIRMAKESSTVTGLADAVAILTSVALQYGVPLEALVKKFAHMQFEPSGFTKNPDIRNTASIVDYIFRWMATQFIPGYRDARGVELPMPGLLEQVKKMVNRPLPEAAGK